MTQISRNIKPSELGGGPNPYDEAQSFTESDVDLTTNNTTLSDGSISILNDSEDGLFPDDFEDGVDTGWSGNTGQLTAVTSPSLTGAQSGNLESFSSSSTVEVTSPVLADTTTNLKFTVRFDTLPTDLVQFIPETADSTSMGQIRFKANGKFAWWNGSSETVLTTYQSGTVYKVEILWDFANNEVEIVFDGVSQGTYSLNGTYSSWDRITVRAIDNGTAYSFQFDSATISATAGNALIEWDRGVPTDIFEWDVATFTRTLDGETVDVFVAYSDDGGSTWTRSNSGNPITRNYSLRDDANITPDVDVRIEAELSRTDTANNPTLNSVYRSWLL
jgi:hypothetical protein